MLNIPIKHKHTKYESMMVAIFLAQCQHGVYRFFQNDIV
jgi:hypothetical protein